MVDFDCKVESLGKKIIFWNFYPKIFPTLFASVTFKKEKKKTTFIASFGGKLTKEGTQQCLDLKIRLNCIVERGFPLLIATESRTTTRIVYRR